MIPIAVPSLGESITQATIGAWLKKEGDPVRADEPVVEVESEKATVAVPAPASGVLGKVLRATGDTVAIGEVIAEIVAATTITTTTTTTTSTPTSPPASPPASTSSPAPSPAPSTVRVPPSARRLMAERGVRKEDVLRALDEARAPALRAPSPGPAPAPAPLPLGERERAVPMTPLRRTVARRLVEAQHAAAILTTFNEVDLSRVLALRDRHGEAFQARHGVKLGFMSFFVKAAVEALRAFPAVNAEVRGTDVIYKDRYDLGVAVGGGKGLVVPVLRDADALSFAEIEVRIGALARKARENRITPDDLAGGTFTISNGGVYGSLLSTPILNPPQSGILGLHKIQKRPVVGEGDQVVVRPMMYLALSYDHRIVDGREAVSFLVRVKEAVEDPERLLLEV